VLAGYILKCCDPDETQDKETSPTFGFNSSEHTAHELGLGGKSLILQVSTSMHI